MSLYAIEPNEQQAEWDRSGLRHTCAACGTQETGRNRLVLAATGFRVHIAHVTTEGDGYYGMPFREAS